MNIYRIELIGKSFYNSGHMIVVADVEAAAIGFAQETLKAERQTDFFTVDKLSAIVLASDVSNIRHGVLDSTYHFQ